MTPNIACKIILPVPGSRYANALFVKIKFIINDNMIIFFINFLYIIIFSKFETNKNRIIKIKPIFVEKRAYKYL